MRIRQEGFGHVGRRASVAWKTLDNRRTDERINRVSEGAKGLAM